jgi:hypothetical protein
MQSKVAKTTNQLSGVWSDGIFFLRRVWDYGTMIWPRSRRLVFGLMTQSPNLFPTQAA